MFDAVYKLLEQIGYPHPIHPTEVHMPIGLIVGALIFRIAATLFRRPALAQTAHYCTILAALFLFPTILFGFMDWQHFYAGAWLNQIKIKLVLAVLLLVLVFVSVFLVQRKRTRVCDRFDELRRILSSRRGPRLLRWRLGLWRYADQGS